MAAFNGSGTYARSYDWTTDAAAGVKIRADRFDEEMDGMATALSLCMLKDGQQTPTANLKMGSYKFTGLAVGSAEADSVTLRQVQANAYGYVASDTGSSNAYAIAPSPAIASYVAGQRFAFIAANASSAASTLAVSGLAAKAIQYQAAALGGAEIKAGALIVVEYDGTQFQMISPSDLLDIAASATVAGMIELATDAETATGAATNRATTPANIASLIGSILQGYDVDTLKADVADELTAGFSVAVYDNGTKTTGTFTPDEANGQIQKYVNGGAHTLAPTAEDTTLVLQCTNDASAGAITTSGFDIVDGDTLTTTDADDFIFYLTTVNGFQHMTVVAMQ